MSKLWTPEGEKAEQAQREAEQAPLFERYRTDRHVRVLADQIHNSRLGAGTSDWCAQCIETAILRVDGRSDKQPKERTGDGKAKQGTAGS